MVQRAALVQSQGNGYGGGLSVGGEVAVHPAEALDADVAALIDEDVFHDARVRHQREDGVAGGGQSAAGMVAVGTEGDGEDGAVQVGVCRMALDAQPRQALVADDAPGLVAVHAHGVHPRGVAGAEAEGRLYHTGMAGAGGVLGVFDVVVEAQSLHHADVHGAVEGVRARFQGDYGGARVHIGGFGFQHHAHVVGAAQQFARPGSDVPPASAVGGHHLLHLPAHGVAFGGDGEGDGFAPGAVAHVEAAGDAEVGVLPHDALAEDEAVGFPVGAHFHFGAALVAGEVGLEAEGEVEVVRGAAAYPLLFGLVAADDFGLPGALQAVGVEAQALGHGVGVDFAGDELARGEGDGLHRAGDVGAGQFAQFEMERGAACSGLHVCLAHPDAHAGLTAEVAGFEVGLDAADAEITRAYKHAHGLHLARNGVAHAAFALPARGDFRLGYFLDDVAARGEGEHRHVVGAVHLFGQHEGERGGAVRLHELLPLPGGLPLAGGAVADGAHHEGESCYFCYFHGFVGLSLSYFLRTHRTCIFDVLRQSMMADTLSLSMHIARASVS